MNEAHCCRAVTELPLSLIHVHGFVSLRHDFGLCAFEVQRLPLLKWLLSPLDALPGAAAARALRMAVPVPRLCPDLPSVRSSTNSLCG
jgi:hypothetical protein